MTQGNEFTDALMDVVGTLVQRRKALRLKQSDVARLLDLKQQDLSHIELGTGIEMSRRIAIIHRYAALLAMEVSIGVSVKELMPLGSIKVLREVSLRLKTQERVNHD